MEKYVPLNYGLESIERLLFPLFFEKVGLHQFGWWDDTAESKSLINRANERSFS